MQKFRRVRNSQGQSLVIMIFIMAFLILGVVGMFAFEVSRANLAREELRAACQAAALAGAASLAGSDISDTSNAHEEAVKAAMVVFKKNRVIGFGLNGATETKAVGDLQTTSATGESKVYFEFLDPNNNNKVVNVGDATGKLLRVSAGFGLQPSFGQYLGISNLPILGIATAGVPMLDIVLCFDVSGSIDDQTPVTFVKRMWDGSNGKISYVKTSTTSGATAGAVAEGKLYDIVGPPATGTGLNGTFPQDLSASSTGGVRWPVYFSENSGAGSNAAVGLRGKSNAGSPPGNYPGQGAGTGTSRTFTDLVVNIDGKNQFAGITSDGFEFPDLATLVEASRGNLEDEDTFNNSKANTSVTVVPKPGYQQKYFDLAQVNTQPIYSAQQAADLFFRILNHDTDAHFGLVAFSDPGGTSPTDAPSDWKVDNNYQSAGKGNYPRPQIVLDPTIHSTNFTTIVDVLPKTRAFGSTNIGDAMNKALSQLKNHSRIGSRKAIVVFTDGQPTAGGPLDSDPWKNARKAAKAAKAEGIPVYTIGLAQNAEIIPGEKAILNDWNSNEDSGGIAGIAGNGGRFFLVTNQQNLRYTFENLARQLVLLVRGESS